MKGGELTDDEWEKGGQDPKELYQEYKLLSPEKKIIIDKKIMDKTLPLRSINIINKAKELDPENFSDNKRAQIKKELKEKDAQSQIKSQNEKKEIEIESRKILEEMEKQKKISEDAYKKNKEDELTVINDGEAEWKKYEAYTDKQPNQTSFDRITQYIVSLKKNITANTPPSDDEKYLLYLIVKNRDFYNLEIDEKKIIFEYNDQTKKYDSIYDTFLENSEKAGKDMQTLEYLHSKFELLQKNTPVPDNTSPEEEKCKEKPEGVLRQQCEMEEKCKKEPEGVPRQRCEKDTQREFEKEKMKESAENYEYTPLNPDLTDSIIKKIDENEKILLESQKDLSEEDRELFLLYNKKDELTAAEKKKYEELNIKAPEKLEFSEYENEYIKKLKSSVTFFPRMRKTDFILVKGKDGKETKRNVTTETFESLAPPYDINELYTIYQLVNSVSTAKMEDVRRAITNKDDIIHGIINKKNDFDYIYEQKTNLEFKDNPLLSLTKTKSITGPVKDRRYLLEGRYIDRPPF
jgi:hypothetical protein